MNLPNRLTIARVIMIPFFLVFLMTDFFPEADMLHLQYLSSQASQTCLTVKSQESIIL